MNYLLDTHIFLWMISEPSKLSDKVKKILINTKNTIYFSAASGLEIIIKSQIGKLTLPEKPEKYIIQQLKKNSIISLNITLSHALMVNTLPNIHKDPFDRILIAQAITEKIPIITFDANISKYDLEIIW